MDERIVVEHAEVVRAIIARIFLGDTDSALQLGQVSLRPHQAGAAGRLRPMLEHSGGALLADEVGLGKTYTALAVAAGFRSPLIVTPASLLEMWKRSSSFAGITADFVSHEALSRRGGMMKSHDLVIVDEAHHSRNPATRRYSQLARLCAGARVLLLSATPIHNAERDLRALFALFQGSRAWSCNLNELTSLVLRREQSGLGERVMPVALPPKWLALPTADDVLDAIQSLPPPLPPSDGGDGGVLVAHGLIRQWSSSDAALRSALIRRRARAVALAAALDDGRYPTVHELRAWSHAEDAVQLAFPGLISAATASTKGLLAVVQAHEAALQALQKRLGETGSADYARAQHLRSLRKRHPGARIVAFTQFADTATGLFRLLAPQGACAVLTARGALTVGGRLSRREALERFNAPTVAPAERIDLLLTTDLLSEGIDLPEVTIVVHLDLPWTAARMEQRVGRALRLNSRYREVHVYCMSAPASAEALLRVEAVLCRKLGDAAGSVGISGAILPPLAQPFEVSDESPLPPSIADERIRAVLGRWTRRSASFPDGCVISGVASTSRGWLALLERGGRSILAASVDGRVTEDITVIAQLMECYDGDGRRPSRATCDRILEELVMWLDFRRGASTIDISVAPGSRSGKRLLQRIAAIAGRAPLHRRGQIVSLASRARRAVLVRQGIESERLMTELAESPMGDEPWLRAIGEFAGAAAEPVSAEDRSYRLRALLILCPP